MAERRAEHGAERRANSLAKGLTEWKKKLTRENMIVVALLGLLLMVIAIPTGGKKETDEADGTYSGQDAAQENGKNGEASEGENAAGSTGYAERMEKELEELLSSMEGVGEAKVMVTLRASGQQVVEKDVPSESERTSETDSAGGTREVEHVSAEESTVYITDSGGSRTPYVSQTTEPEIEGVTVVAQGGGDALVQKNITEVIQALFGIEAHKIKVVKMK